MLDSTLLCYLINIPTFSHYTQYIHSVAASVQYEAFFAAFFQNCYMLQELCIQIWNQHSIVSLKLIPCFVIINSLNYNLLS